MLPLISINGMSNKISSYLIFINLSLTCRGTKREEKDEKHRNNVNRVTSERAFSVNVFI